MSRPVESEILLLRNVGKVVQDYSCFRHAAAAEFYDGSAVGNVRRDRIHVRFEEGSLAGGQVVLVLELR